MRLYGKTLNTWTGYSPDGKRIETIQYEISYKDCYGDVVVGVGSEDFSPARLKMTTRRAFIYTWDGETYNKGGYRWFECRGFIHYRRSEVKEVISWLKQKYGAARVELR